MDIRVGEYVRTKFGYIAKIESIYVSEYTGETMYECDSTVYMDYGDPVRYFEGKDELEKFVVKHSEFIWELIEKGDYVNGHKVEEIWENEYRFGGCDYMFQVTGDKIKSIVTKELMKSVEYEVIK